MLVLTRKQQEQIRIGDQVTVTILRIKGNTVRIGIEAPRQVRVVRAELGPLEESEPEVSSDRQSSASPSSASAIPATQSPPPRQTEAENSARGELIRAIRQHLAGAVC